MRLPSQAKAFAYAGQMGAAMVNASLGGTGSSSLVSDAILNTPNTLFVVAAGNDTSNNDAVPKYPCQYPRANIVCVAASTMSDGLSSFSNWGATSVDLAAPGSNILSDYLPISFNDPFTANAKTGPSADEQHLGLGRFPGSQGRVPRRQSGRQLCERHRLIREGHEFPQPTGKTGCKLNYFMRLATEFGFDYVEPEGSINGTTWTPLGGWWGSTGGAWQSVQNNLSAYDGQATFHLRFHFHSNASIVGAGADLNDVMVQCTTSSLQSFAYLQGTSMATPHVAGAAALLKAEEPSATPSRSRTRSSTASTRSQPSPESR